VTDRAHAALQDRFRAAILGLAIGDALGFPVRGVPPSALQRLPDLAEDFAPRPRGRFPQGQFSDDTQLALVAAEAVVQSRAVDGRRFAQLLAETFAAGALLQPSRAVSEAAERLQRGMPWMSSGAPIGQSDASCLSRGVVVGLWQPDPRRLAREASVLTVVTHKEPTCAAACAALARGVALSVQDEGATPRALCDAMAQAAAAHDPELGAEIRHLPRLLTWEVDRAAELIRRVGVSAATLAGEGGEGGLSNHPWPVLLLGTYAALRLPHDFRQAVAVVLRWGGEADAAAAVCGALLGALHGEAALPPRLKRHVLDGPRLVALADALLEARVEVQAMAARAVR
jgi:ADP-ribosylglycohydrolase